MSQHKFKLNPLSKPLLKDSSTDFLTLSSLKTKQKIHLNLAYIKLSSIVITVVMLSNFNYAYAQDAVVKKSIQTMPILQGISVPSSENSTSLKPKVKEVAILVDGNSLSSRPQSIDNGEEITQSLTDLIATYDVEEGDTLSEIAQKYGITANTIVWANDLDSNKALKKGQTLIILPVSGVKYVIKKGDSLKKVAETFKGDVDEIISYNNLANEADIQVGLEIIIPKGEITKQVSVKTSNTKLSNIGKDTKSLITGKVAKDNVTGYFIRPTKGVKTQGLHGHNGIDFASSLNSPIYAAASGKVIIVKNGGWNGGYGTYIVIAHNNGTQTMYAHLNGVNTNQGDVVNQGQVIGFMGSTGDSTGVHIHFEVRGGVNPF